MDEKKQITREQQLKGNKKGGNFIGKNGKLFLVRCFNCEPEYGTENSAMAVVSGQCAWCGWKEDKD
ncbi:hypothetical protein LCGC14_2966370 [marine sediment metagenome]|uniref:Uncharacterized protein n=1 Tax=marine sediment metagenome TaxID=412755 RepID=A0A0F8XAN0_9ZZZZ